MCLILYGKRILKNAPFDLAEAENEKPYSSADSIFTIYLMCLYFFFSSSVRSSSKRSFFFLDLNTYLSSLSKVKIITFKGF